MTHFRTIIYGLLVTALEIGLSGCTGFASTNASSPAIAALPNSSQAPNSASNSAPAPYVPSTYIPSTNFSAPGDRGFNETFIYEYICSQSADLVTKFFGPAALNYPGMQCASYVPYMDFVTINYWVNLFATSTGGGGTPNVFRDFIASDYLAPDIPGCNQPYDPNPACHPFDADIAAVLSIFQANQISLILTFGVVYSGTYQEPQWVTNDVNANGGDMLRRAQDHAAIISAFLDRMYNNYGDASWRQWFAASVRIEPQNEVNGLYGQPVFAATLDNQVRANLASTGTLVQKVISSSIVSTDSATYLSWYWNDQNTGYYQVGGTWDTPPNIHLYYYSGLDGGSFANSITRFYQIIDTLYNQAKPGITPVIVGEVGHSYNNVMQDSTDVNSQAEHDSLITNVINGVNWYEIESLTFWKLLGLANVNCYAYPNTCGDTFLSIGNTYGVVHLPYSGNGNTMAATPLCVEQDVATVFNLPPIIAICPP